MIAKRESILQASENVTYQLRLLYDLLFDICNNLKESEHERDLIKRLTELDESIENLESIYESLLSNDSLTNNVSELLKKQIAIQEDVIEQIHKLIVKIKIKDRTLLQLCINIRDKKLDKFSHRLNELKNKL